jgi:hypothetical protein
MEWHDRDMTIARRYNLALRDEPVASDHYYCDVPNVMELSEFKPSAISYIAGEMFGRVDNVQREDSQCVPCVEIEWRSEVTLQTCVECGVFSALKEHMLERLW